MLLNRWLVEFLLGTIVLLWARPRVLALSQSLRVAKQDVAVPIVDNAPSYWPWIGRGIGLTIGVLVLVLLGNSSAINLLIVLGLFWGLGEYLGEWLSQQVLPAGHPWRVAVDDMAACLGVHVGEVRYRQCAEWGPYAGIGGITLPSRALRKLDGTSLRFAIVGALIARQRRTEWTRFGNWVLIGGASFVFFQVNPILLGHQMFFNSVGFLLWILWLIYTPARIPAVNSAAVDRLALQHTDDFQAACLAIQMMDTSENATRRIRALKTWWDTYQQEQAVKAGTLAPLQPSNTQTQTLNRTP